MNTDTSKKSAELKSRINNYLENGGFFNPEHMDHEKVSELLLECRDFLASVPQGVVIFTKEMADAWGFKKDPSDEVWYPEDAKFSRCNPNCEEFQEREIYRRSRPAPQPVVEDLKVIEESLGFTTISYQDPEKGILAVLRRLRSRAGVVGWEGGSMQAATTQKFSAGNGRNVKY
jgi:hypothetical protein